MTEDENNINRVVHIPFKTMGDIKDMKYLDGIWMTYRGDHMRVEQEVRRTLGAAHGFRPTDRNAIYVANLMEQLSQFRIITAALEVLMAFIGSLTLGIAGIGLMNIMLVSVQQRTREIGVEKALGARKRHILIQFLAEALVISATGGVLGMLLAYAVSLGMGRITFYSAIAQNADRCGHTTADIAAHRCCFDRDPDRRWAGKRDGAGAACREPRPDRSVALRVTPPPTPTPPVTAGRVVSLFVAEV